MENWFGIPDDVQTRVGGHPTSVGLPAAGIEHREVHEAVIGAETGAPHHGADRHRRPVREYRVPVAGADHAGNPSDACGYQLARPDPAQRFRAAPQPPARQRRPRAAEEPHQR